MGAKMQERGKIGTFVAKQASRYQGDCIGLAIWLVDCGHVSRKEIG